MVSAIDPSKPQDGIPAIKAELRTNLQAAKDEIEALQAGSGLAEGAVASEKLADASVTLAKLASGTPERFLGFDAVGLPAERGAPTSFSSTGIAADRPLTGSDVSRTLVGQKTDAGDLALTLPDGVLVADTQEIAIVNAQPAGKLVTVERSGTVEFVVNSVVQTAPAQKISLGRGQAGTLFRTPGDSTQVLAIGPWAVEA